MLVALSNIIGPLQDLSLEKVSRVDGDTMPGVVKFNNEPGDDNVFEIDGKLVSGWLSWHFDACYAGVLNRGGVLRVVVNPPEGGLTGFADGIQLYNAISPELRAKFEDLPNLYQIEPDVHEPALWPAQAVSTNPSPGRSVEAIRRSREGAAVNPSRNLERSSGEHVLHVSAFQAAGIHGHEGPEGDALLEALLQEMYAKMIYWHTWKLTDMAVWDNWRFIHSVSGNDPKYRRCVHRTTINGDYGLGALETRHHVP